MGGRLKRVGLLFLEPEYDHDHDHEDEWGAGAVYWMGDVRRARRTPKRNHQGLRSYSPSSIRRAC